MIGPDSTFPTGAARPRPCFFLHIPKTGGVSAARMIGRRYAPERSKDQWPEIFEGNVDDYDFVALHFNFGFVGHFRTCPVVITFLREPVARSLSAWRFARTLRRPPHAPTQSFDSSYRLFRDAARQHSLLGLLTQAPELARLYLGNVQTALLMEAPVKPAPDVPLATFGLPQTASTTAQLAAAMRHLERCDVIGITENFATSMQAVADALDWEPFEHVLALNITAADPNEPPVEPEALEILASWTALDRELYARGKELARTYAGRRAEGPHPQPPAGRIAFDEPLHVDGWHARERDEHGWFCWTGASEWSGVYLRAPVARRAHRLTMRIAHLLTPAALEGLQLRVNGLPVAPTVVEVNGEKRIEAVIDAETATARPRNIRIEIRPGARCRPTEVNPHSTDTRLLAIAFREILLQPIG